MDKFRIKRPEERVKLLERLSDKQRWVICCILLFMSLFLLISIISYYFTWNDGASANSAGKFGYSISTVLVGSWFGVFAICIPILMIILALRVMHYRPTFLERSVRVTLILTILGSLTLGFFFGYSWNIFSSGLGGRQGVIIIESLQEVIGKIGVGLLLLMCWILFLVYINKHAISVLNKIGGAFLRKFSGIFTSKPKEVEEEDGEQLIEELLVSREDIQMELENPYPFIDTDTPQMEICEDEDEDEGSGKKYTKDGAFEIVNVDDMGMVGLDGTPIDFGLGGIIEKSEDGLKVIKAEHQDEEVEEEEIDIKPYDPTRELAKYQRPPLQILNNYDNTIDKAEAEIDMRENQERITQTLADFGINIKKIISTMGPTVTLYEIEPAEGVKINRITSLEANIALSVKAMSIRMIAPMPGKGTIGIEIPNRNRTTVSMYSMIKSAKFQDTKYELPIVLGKTIQNKTFMIDLADMPHLLVAGATGQGKSVGLNVIINSLIYKKHPAELKFVLVDPKRVELSLYAKLEKHFLAKMESEDDAILTEAQKVVYTLNALTIEMTERYKLLQKAGVRKITEYNAKFLERKLNPLKGHRFLPYIVVIIDEFADIIMTAGKEIETPINSLARLARAIGIHLVVATQRPDVKVITGTIKANFPARIAFRVTSIVDSRTIIDQLGANQLVGKGDMLVMINGEITRLQCAFLDTPEIERITEFISKQKSYTSAYLLPDYTPEESSMTMSREEMGATDPMLREIARFVVDHQQGSTSYVQRRFSIGYNRAGRIMDQLEGAGIVGRSEGSKPREVIVSDVVALEQILDRFI